MVAVVVDQESLEALRDMKAWIDAIPQDSLTGLDLPDLDLDWVETVIKNNNGSDFAYKSGDRVELLSSVSEDEFGCSFKLGMIGRFSFLIFSVFILMFSFMLFDTPGSTTNPLTLALFIFFLSYPILYF